MCSCMLARSVPDAAERSGLFAVRVRGVSDRRAGDRRDGARRAGACPPITRCRSATISMRWRSWSIERTRLVFVANPNNPTGTWVERRRAARVHRARCRRRRSWCVDEAYIEYVDASRLSRRAAAGCSEFPEPGRDAHLLEGLWARRSARRLCAVASGGRGHAQSRAPAVQRQLDRAGRGAAPRSMTASICSARSRPIAPAWRSCSAGLRRAAACAIMPSAGNFVLVDCGRPAAAGLRSAVAAGRDRAAGRQLPAAESPAHHDRNAARRTSVCSRRSSKHCAEPRAAIDVRTT